MLQHSSQTPSDLLTLIQKFEPSKFKILTSGIEIRGMINIHNSIARAKSIIDNFNLNLTIHHSAEMLSYKGFEVKLPC